MVDGVSFPAAGYLPAGAQPAANRQPTPIPPSAQPSPPTHAADAPSVVVDFSAGASSSYVIEWRDPSTHEVLLQLPMRSALPQTANSAPAARPAGHGAAA